MAQKRQTIEEYMKRKSLSDRDAFIVAWKWAHSYSMPNVVDMRQILADVRAYRASSAGRKKKPDYVTRFEDYETSTYVPTLPEHTWRAVNKGF